jgi:branched-subunit amino acid permease
MLKSLATSVVLAQAAGGDIIESTKGKAMAALTAAMVIVVAFAGVMIVVGAKKQRTADSVSHGVRVLVGAVVFALGAGMIVLGTRVAQSLGLV